VESGGPRDSDQLSSIVRIPDETTCSHLDGNYRATFDLRHEAFEQVILSFTTIFWVIKMLNRKGSLRDMMNDKRVLRSFIRSLAGAAVGVMLATGYGTAANAADYTKQEKANIEVVRALFAALNEGEAKGDQASAAATIAEKYMAADFQQHGNTPRDRAAWVAIFQGRVGGGGGDGPPGGGPPGAGGPNAGGPSGGGPPGAGGPGAGPPGGGPGAGGPPGGGGRGANAGPRQPQRELSVMANTDLVGHTQTRDGNTITYHLFRLKDGKITEEW
jgi:hypothetical protein